MKASELADLLRTYGDREVAGLTVYGALPEHTTTGRSGLHVELRRSEITGRREIFLAADIKEATA